MTSPQHGVVTRQRLLQVGRRLKAITLVSAPAGYGKTTLLRQWIPDAGEVVRLDPAEVSDGWELWRQVNDTLGLPDVTVIIDDIHLLEGERNARELEKALRRAGGSRRLVIATRRDPILALGEARLAGKVAEIRAEDLAFDEAETRLFLAVNDIAATPEEAHAIWLHTEGWPAGLRLSALPLSRAAHSREAFSTLLHGDTAVGSYLMGQTLAYASDALRDFLMRTSVTEVLDDELAQQLSGRSDSALLLEQAHSEPGFLHRLSRGRWPYRYHPMFRALLLAELMRSAPDEARRLSAVAAAWLLGRGEHIRAAPLALQGQAWDVMSDAILAGSCVALATGEWSWVRTAYARLPEGHRESNLSVRLSAALMKLETGSRSEAMALVSALLGSPLPPANSREAEVLDLLEAWLLAELGQPRQAIQILNADHDHSLVNSASASKALRTAWRQLHAACLFADGSPRRVDALLDDRWPSNTALYPKIEIGALEIRSWAAIVAGNLEAARRDLDRVTALVAHESDIGRSDWPATILSAFCWLELETGIEPPRPTSDAAGQTPSVFPLPISQALNMISESRSRLARDNDFRGSALTLDELASEQPQVRHWWSTGYLWTFARTEAHLAAGEFSSALVLALNSSAAKGVREGTLHETYLWAWVMQRAALERASGPTTTDPDRLIGNLPIESAMLAGRSEALRIRVVLAAASLAFRAGMADRASHYLRLALQSTQLHHWRRPYKEIAESIAPVLEAERRRISPYGEQVVELLDQLRRQPAGDGRLPDPLSVRELEILQYLPTPLDQRELCSALSISRNTLKTHLRSTYWKLGVQTRREAVLQAERLGIL